MIPSLFNNTGTGPAPEQTAAAPAGKTQESTEIKNVEPSKVETDLKLALSAAVTNWPEMTRMAIACEAALSGITVIENDEQEESAKKVLSKASATYTKIEKMRKETTSKLDEIKKDMMQPEKKISTLANDKDSIFWKAKSHLNVYANKKLAEQQAKEKEALRVQYETEELARLKGEFEMIFHNNIIDYVSTMESNISKYFNSLKLEGWSESIKRFSLKPALKIETFESWFNVPFDNKKLTQEVYDDMVSNVRSIYTYEVINNIYVEQAQPKVDEYKKKLPARKKELTALAELEKTNAEAAAKQKIEMEATAAAQQKAISDTADKEKAEKSFEVDRNQKAANLGAQFETLKVTQNQEDIAGRKKNVAVVNCEPTHIVEVFAKVLYICFTNPEFKGYLKRDKKTGEILPSDENGIPQYEDWAKTLLTFYAENSDVKIDGVDIKQIISTSVRKEKETE